MNEAERLQAFVGQQVVVDTDSALLYVGTLKSVDEAFYEIESADLHDSSSTSTTRDVYIINVRKHGIKKNRERVLIRTARVVSVSLLSDVTEY